MAARNSKIAKKTLALRQKLFPDLNPADLWDRKKSAGFTTIPRTLPIVMNIIDDLTSGKPASKTYFALWTRSYDEMLVTLNNVEDLAFQSGFTGQRAARTWKERMEALNHWGFIKVVAGARGSLSNAVIMNPHFVIRRLKAQNIPEITEAAYLSLVERANDIGEIDMECALPEVQAEQTTAFLNTLTTGVPKMPQFPSVSSETE